MKNKINKLNIIAWFGNWISSWLDMICGAISVITLCLWRPWWDFKFRCWFSKFLFDIKK